jgi:hypothetical protein
MRSGLDLPSFADTPGNGVEKPEEGSERSAHQKGSLDVAAKGLGVDAGFPGELVDDVEESDTACSLESVLISLLSKDIQKTTTYQRQSMATCRRSG